MDGWDGRDPDDCARRAEYDDIEDFKGERGKEMEESVK